MVACVCASAVLSLSGTPGSYLCKICWRHLVTRQGPPAAVALACACWPLCVNAGCICAEQAAAGSSGVSETHCSTICYKERGWWVWLVMGRLVSVCSRYVFCAACRSCALCSVAIPEVSRGTSKSVLSPGCWFVITGPSRQRHCPMICQHTGIAFIGHEDSPSPFADGIDA